MVYKALTNGLGGNLNNAKDGFGYGNDTVVVIDNSLFDWGSNEIRTYEGNDYIDASGLNAVNTHCVIPGAGDDYYIGNRAMDSLRDGMGNDVYILGDGVDILYSGYGNDVVDAGAGDDIVYFNFISGDGRASDQVNYSGVTYDLANEGTQNLGVFGYDTLIGFEDIVGSQGSDVFYGTAVSNTIWSYSGNDVLYGRGGNDTLYAYGGNDIIIGGSGADKINLDEDGFYHWHASPSDYEHFRSIVRYTSVSDSPATFAGRDHIYWFEKGTGATADRIDLSRIDANHFKSGDQAFSFTSSTSRFASSGGEIRLQEYHTGTSNYTVVHIDTDSDSSDEMQIVVNGVVGLTRGDFIL